MTIRMKAVLATFIAPAFAAATAQAADAGLYFGGSVGQTTAKASASVETSSLPDFETFHFDKTDTGYKAFVGYNFLPFLGVEGGYVDFGSPSDNTHFGGITVNGQVDATGWEAFVVGTLPIGPVDLFVKAGGIESSIDLKVNDTLGRGNKDSESNEMFAYGAGAAVNFGNFALRVEAEGYDVSKLDDLYFISLGATYHL